MMNAVISAFMALAQLVGVVVLAVCAMFALAAFVKKVIRSGHVELQQAGGKPRRVLVTGCDTGFGNMVAKKLHAEGWRVVAACLTEQAAQALNTECGDRMDAIRVDVTKDADVDAAVQHVRQSGSDLWAVINNAGINGGLYVEWNSVRDYERVMSVNFFGGVRVIKAFVPLLRESKGRIVNVTSICGFLAFPGASAYCSSKFAFNAYTDCLRLEMASWGVKVCTLEPGFFLTAIVKSAAAAYDKRYRSLPAEERARWGDAWWAQRQKKLAMAVSLAKDPMQVVNTMVEAVSARSPNARYRIGWDAKYLYGVIAALPTGVQDAIWRVLDYQSEKPAAQLKWVKRA